jgi:ribonuclease-3
MDALAQLEESIEARFKNQDLLKEALTHRSYLNENPQWPLPHNERMEFLGDAVLELVVTEKLYELFPKFPEGQLTVLRAALVNYQILGRIAASFNLEKAMFMSRGERGDNARAKEVILANAFEALVGALYLDQGLAAVEQFAEDFLMVHLDEILETKSYKDAKSALQEMVQEKLRVTPTYETLEETGPAHERRFRIGVRFGAGGKVVAEGMGSSKQEAEIEAAKKALEKYQNA